MVVSKSDGLAVKRVDLWSFQDRVTCAGEVSVALIVSHHNHDVGLFRRRQTVGQCDDTAVQAGDEREEISRREHAVSLEWTGSRSERGIVLDGASRQG